ncbi:hypothetical protein HMPREF0731_1048, partial [Pseudoroseomonas cervicalis ATCC 49957]
PRRGRACRGRPPAPQRRGRPPSRMPPSRVMRRHAAPVLPIPQSSCGQSSPAARAAAVTIECAFLQLMFTMIVFL